MLIIAILTIIAFAWLYNTTNFDKVGINDVARMYGKTITQADVERDVRNYRLAFALGQLELLQDLGGLNPDSSAAIGEFIWNLRVLQHECKALGIRPSDEQVVAAVRAIPAFRGENGAYDPTLFARFAETELGPRGFTEQQIFDLVRDSLSLSVLKKIVQSPVTVSPEEVAFTKRMLQPVTASYVLFDLNAFASKVNTTEEEIETFYNENKAHLTTPEYRSVSYVRFSLPEEARGKQGRERVEALQEMANKATAFLEQLAEGGATLEEKAKAAGLDVTRTPEFTADGQIRVLEGLSPETLNLMRLDKPELVEIAFRLSEGAQNAEATQIGDDFYVVALERREAPRELTLAEARPQIEARLRMEHAQEALRKEAEETAVALREAVAGGKSFAVAAAERGLEVRTIRNASPQSQSLSPEESGVIATTQILEPGEIGGAYLTRWGGLIVYLDSREEGNAAEIAAEEKQIRESLLESKKQLVFAEWLRTAVEASGLEFLRGAEGS